MVLPWTCNTITQQTRISPLHEETESIYTKKKKRESNCFLIELESDINDQEQLEFHFQLHNVKVSSLYHYLLSPKTE